MQKLRYGTTHNVHCTCTCMDFFYLCVCMCELCRKVQMMEDLNGIIHPKHLSLHQATNEEEGERNERDVFVCDLSTAMFHPALNWLFLGDTNRMIAEVCALCVCVCVCEREREREMILVPFLQTPMNMASTRSYCIFTIHISS